METEISPKKISKRKVDFALSKVPIKDRRISMLALSSAQSRRNSKILNPYDNLIISSNGMDRGNSHKLKSPQLGILGSDINDTKMIHKIGGAGENQNFYEGMLAKYKNLNNASSNNNQTPLAQPKDKTILPTIHTEDNLPKKEEVVCLVNTSNTKMKSVIEPAIKNPFKLRETSKFMNHLQPFLKGNAKSPNKNRIGQSIQIIKPPINYQIIKSESNLINEKEQIVKSNSDQLKKSSSNPNSQTSTQSQKTQKKKRGFQFWCCF